MNDRFSRKHQEKFSLDQNHRLKNDTRLKVDCDPSAFQASSGILDIIGINCFSSLSFDTLEKIRDAVGEDFDLHSIATEVRTIREAKKIPGISFDPEKADNLISDLEASGIDDDNLLNIAKKLDNSSHRASHAQAFHILAQVRKMLPNITMEETLEKENKSPTELVLLQLKQSENPEHRFYAHVLSDPAGKLQFECPGLYNEYSTSHINLDDEVDFKALNLAFAPEYHIKEGATIKDLLLDVKTRLEESPKKRSFKYFDIVSRYLSFPVENIDKNFTQAKAEDEPLVEMKMN